MKCGVFSEEVDARYRLSHCAGRGILVACFFVELNVGLFDVSDAADLVIFNPGIGVETGG